MKVYVSVHNAEWEDGCDDTPDHDHPSEFTAFVTLPDDIDIRDTLAMDAAIHDALIEQCDCCIIEGNFVVDWIAGTKEGHHTYQTGIDV